MKNKSEPRKPVRPVEIDDEQLADVSGGTADASAEVIRDETILDENDSHRLPDGMVLPVGAIVEG